MRLQSRDFRTLLLPRSLAARLDGSTCDYLLLDRDERFAALGDRYRPFDLRAPERQADFDFDAIFLDPPFANVMLEELATATRVLLDGRDPAETPLYVGYNLKRAHEVEGAFADFNLKNTDEVLVYASGVMPDQIVLFSNR